MPEATYREPSSRLGDLRATYGARTPRHLLVILWLATPLLLAGSAALTYALIFESNDAALGDLAGAIVMNVLIALLGVALPFVWFRNRNKTVRLFEQGIEFEHRARLVPIRWDEIASVYFTHIKVRVNGIPAGRQMTCTIEGPSFGRITVNQWFDRADELARDVERAIYPRIVEQNANAWSRGEPVTFGMLTLTAEGLTVGKKRIAWSDVEQFWIDGGRVTVRARGKLLPWASLARAKVPNAMALQTLVSRIRGR